MSGFDVLVCMFVRSMHHEDVGSMIQLGWDVELGLWVQWHIEHDQLISTIVENSISIQFEHKSNCQQDDCDGNWERQPSTSWLAKTHSEILTPEGEPQNSTTNEIQDLNEQPMKKRI